MSLRSVSLVDSLLFFRRDATTALERYPGTVVLQYPATATALLYSVVVMLAQRYHTYIKTIVEFILSYGIISYHTVLYDIYMIPPALAQEISITI